jgi:hypothetical protein
MAQSPNTQEVKNPFTEGNQQSAGEQRGEHCGFRTGLQS